MYVRVAVDAGAASGLNFLSYSVPDELQLRVHPGACVLVPLRNAQTTGFVVGFDYKPEVETTKDIIAVLEADIHLTEEAVEFAQWLADNYLTLLPACFKALVPPSMNFTVRCDVVLSEDEDRRKITSKAHLKIVETLEEAGGTLPLDDLKNRLVFPGITAAIRELEKKGVIERRYEPELPKAKPRLVRMVSLALSLEDAKAAARTVRSKRQSRVLQDLINRTGPVPVSELARCAGVSLPVINELEKRRFISITETAVRRSPTFTPIDTGDIRLSRYQDEAVRSIAEAVSSSKRLTYLLHGVTASGKTEVYLRSIETALTEGKSAIVLLPEISLTSQVLDVFKGRFADEVAVIHSRLSSGERYDEWMRISRGEARVVIGARSALFSPVRDLGLVVVDEEHEPSYKQESDPRYHARDAAVKRGESSGAPVVLGSATPAVESYYAALTGRYKLISLPERIQERPLPKVEVADLREEYAKGQPTMFSQRLREAVEDCLSKKQQVILFQNRRAYATFILCRECGYTAVCPHCAVSLKFHREERVLRCHHCDFRQPAPTLCPSCSGRKIGQFGVGTERVEEETRKAFPEARILRMDRDTTGTKDAHRKILTAFRNGEADILIGTQMVAKGLDFPKVTLVGVISADTSLRMPDFRAAERTFQLLSQVAGRAGRGEEPGEVIIQTFDPDNYSIQCALSHDYIGFYNQEIAARQELQYPPFTHFVNIVAADPVESAAQKRVETLVKSLRIHDGKGLEILGPAQAAIAKLRGDYRWHAALKSADRASMLLMLQKALDQSPSIRRGLVIDVDPVAML